MTYRVMSNLRGSRVSLLFTGANNFAPSVLAVGGETVSGLRINSVWMGSNTGAVALIARGANTVLAFPPGQQVVDFAQAKFPMALDAAANVNVSFSAAGTNTLIVEFQKISDKEDDV